MVKVEVKEPNGETISYYMDEGLKNRLESKVKEKMVKKDKDLIWIFDGDEGSGKSSFAFQIAKFIDSSFNIERVCMNPNEFIHQIAKANKGDVIIYDEAYT